jgi:hypothetical protein
MAIAIGCAGLGLHLRPAVLASPTSCPGLLERLAIVGAQLGRSAPLGLWLVRANRIILIAVLSTFARLAYAATGTWAIAAAASLAFASGPTFAVAMSAFDPMAVGVAGVTLLSLFSRTPEGQTARRSIGRAWLCLLLTAAIVPPAALPMAAIAAWQAVLGTPRGILRLRWVVAGLSSIALLGTVAILVVTTPSPPPWIDPTLAASCLVPGPAGGWASRSMRALSGLAASAGPFACSLAGLGALSLRARLSDKRTWPTLAYISMPAVMGVWPDASPDRTLAPALVALWLMTALGLVEVVRACRRSAGGRLAAVAMIVLLPLSHVARADLARKDQSSVSGRAEPEAAALGHDRMSLEGVRRALQVMPDRSVIISEDAGTDMLLRGLDGTWQRSGKTVQMVSSRQDDIAAAVRNPSAHVFALPRAQAELPYLGFRLVDASLPGVSGLSEVEPGGECHAVEQEWEPIPEISRSTMLVLVVRNAREEGAVAIYAGSDHPIDPRPIDWPALVTGGFRVSSYARTDQDRVRLEHDVLEDALARNHPVLNQPFVVRLELWKMRAAPALLALDLGAVAPSLGVAHATPEITVQLCPGFPHAVRAVALPR